MISLQETPISDGPAEIQAPMVEHVVQSARRIQPQRSSILWPVLVSYILSVFGGFLVVYLVNLVFGSPYNQGLIQYDTSLWKLGVPLSLIVSFLLGLFLPILFARRRKFSAIFYTMLFLFITLVILVIVGLWQLSVLTGNA